MTDRIEELTGRIGRGIVAVQNSEPEHVVLAMLRGEASYDHNTVVFEQEHPRVQGPGNYSQNSDEEREELTSLLDSPQHAPMSTHSGTDGSCQDCPWPLAHLPVEEIADAILAAGFRRPTQSDPTDAQTSAAARALNANGWTCDGGAHEPGHYATCEDCQRACDGLARVVLRAAFAVQGGESR